MAKLPGMTEEADTKAKAEKATKPRSPRRTVEECVSLGIDPSVYGFSKAEITKARNASGNEDGGE